MKDLKLVLFDLDGTIVKYEDGNFQSSWDALGKAAGIWEEWEKRVRYYYPRPELYAEWINANTHSLQGLLVQPILEKILPPPYTAGFREFCSYLQQQKIRTGIVSSGVGFVAEHVRQEMSLDFVVANEVLFEDGRFSGACCINVPLWDKGRIVAEILQQQNVSPQEAAFFGDNKNDLEAWRKVSRRYGIEVKDESCLPHLDHCFPDFVAAKKYFVGRA